MVTTLLQTFSLFCMKYTFRPSNTTAYMYTYGWERVKSHP